MESEEIVRILTWFAWVGETHFKQGLSMKLTDHIDKESLRDDVPEFSPGDTVKVHVRVVEGNRERVQIFEGAVIARRGH